MVVRLLSKLPLGGNKNYIATLQIHRGRQVDLKIVKIYVVVDPDVLFIIDFDSMDLKFNCESYGPNVGTAKISVGQDNLKFLQKADQYLMNLEKHSTQKL